MEEINNMAEQPLEEQTAMVSESVEIFDEEATDDDETKEEDPFDPEKISIDTKVFAMEGILRKMQQNTLNLCPDFQRDEVWTPSKRSQLIESLMLKIPIPMFYVSSDEYGNLSVVDGVQRLSTIRDFVLGKDYLESIDPKTGQGEYRKKGKGFALKNLEFWSSYNGKQFADLPPMLQNRILDTDFQFTVINPGTPEEVKLNIFKRINTGGIPLSSQEIRNAIYSGQACRLLDRLVSDHVFESATGGSLKNAKRKEDRELALRMLSFIIREYKSYNRTVSTDQWLGETMIILNALPNLDTRDYLKLLKSRGSSLSESIHLLNDEQICSLFHTAMSRCKEVFGEHAFRKSHDYARRSSINRCLFEMWGFIMGRMSEKKYHNLLNHKYVFLQEYYELLDSWDFQRSITRDSMKHISVKYRFKTLIDLTNKYTVDYAD